VQLFVIGSRSQNRFVGLSRTSVAPILDVAARGWDDSMVVIEIYRKKRDFFASCGTNGAR